MKELNLPTSKVNEAYSPILIDGNSLDIPFSRWLNKERYVLERLVLKHGAVLLRGFQINSIKLFHEAVSCFNKQLLSYVYRSTPRTALGKGIYTATEYPKDRIIPLHNENAYSRSWPEKLFFYCSIPPEVGGQTPIADSRKIYQKIDASLREKFEVNGLMYVRNYMEGVDLSWQEVFQTDSRDEVNEFCSVHGIEFEWFDSGPVQLRTRQTCQASLVHPKTKEKVWFNQAHLFHHSVLPDAMKSMFATALEGVYPRDVRYGNGNEITKVEIEHITEVMSSFELLFNWQYSDLMIVDNLLFCHGRKAYQGNRKILVAMI